MRKFGLLCCVLLFILVTIALFRNNSQTGTSSTNPRNLVQETRLDTTGTSKVPFVGCKSDGQSGPAPRPHGSYKIVHIDATEAQNLAYYASGQDFGVLDQDQLAQLARDEYVMGKDIDTQTLLLGGEFLNTRVKRAMDYLYRLSKQRRPTAIIQP